MHLCRTLTSVGVLALVLLAVFPADSGAADLYQWVDENGTVWFTDSLDKVPPEYRAWAYYKRKKVQEDPSIPTPVNPQSEAATPQEHTASPQDPYASWQERIKKARAELEALKRERQQAQDEHEGIVSQLRVRGSRIDPEKAAQGATTVKELEQRIRDKEYEITTTIPDEARQAGVPPSVLSQ